MKRKWLVLGGGAFLFLALVAIGGCAVFVSHGLHLGFGSLDEKASREDTLALEIGAGETLRAALDHGDIRVEVGDGAPELVASLTAWGRTREEAGEVLARARLEVKRAAGGIEIVFDDGGRDEGVAGGSLRISAGVDYRIRLPRGVLVDLETGSGDLAAEGPLAGARLRSSYGDAHATGILGEVVAASGSGDVSIAGARGPKVSASTEYGDVRITDAEAAEVEAKSGSGDVTADGARCERIHAASDYGDVQIAGVFAGIDAGSGSGDVSVRALPGSRAAEAWKLSSSYGDVTLQLPEGFACDLSAKTEYGDLDLRFPIEVEAGGLKKSEGSVRGKLHGGGGGVALSTGSGDVRVLPLPK